MIDSKNIGQGKTYGDAVDEYDAGHGKYDPAIDKLSQESKLPTSQMPMAPEPKPFKLGG